MTHHHHRHPLTPQQRNCGHAGLSMADAAAGGGGVGGEEGGRGRKGRGEAPRSSVSRASTDAASLRWRATGGGRSSGAARARKNETRSHTHRRARRIQMPLLLCGGKSHQRATRITRGARDARASPAAIHAGVRRQLVMLQKITYFAKKEPLSNEKMRTLVTKTR